MQKKRISRSRGHKLGYRFPKVEISKYRAHTLSQMGGTPFWILHNDKNLYYPVVSPSIVEPIDGFNMFRKMLIRIAARQTMEETLANQVGSDKAEENTEG